MDPADPGHPVVVVPRVGAIADAFFSIRPEIRPAGKNLSAAAYRGESALPMQDERGRRVVPTADTLACF